MDLKFYEMHFEATDQLTLDSATSSFPLLCMTDEAEAFCAINDKVYHITWDTHKKEVGRRPCYTPTSDTSTREIILLHAFHTDNTTVMAVVYYHGLEYCLSVFQLDLETLNITHKREETLQTEQLNKLNSQTSQQLNKPTNQQAKAKPNKPNVVYLYKDLNTANIAVFLTFYSEPCVEVFTYSLSGYLSKVDSGSIRKYYPGLHGLFKLRSVLDKRTSFEYVLCLDILIEGNTSYLVYGTVDGNVHIYVSNSVECLWNAVYDWEGPISSVKLFKVKGIMCLVVACMVEQVVLFTNINHHNKLSKKTILPESTKFDSVTCINIMDIDHDGDNEILIGTYGCMFLVYKLQLTNDELKPYVVYQRSYSSPIYTICFSDITNDGLFEIIILTFSGIHVLQRCLRSAQQYIEKLLRNSTPIDKCPFDDEHLIIEISQPLP